MKNIILVKKKIDQIIKKSSVPEDYVHSKNTLDWLLKLKPNADEGPIIAALSHDIERAIEKRKVRRRDYKDYDAFKDSHALNSAKILAEIMQECNLSEKMIDEVYFLVSLHETGGTKLADILKDADSISFFDVNLPLYFVRNGWPAPGHCRIRNGACGDIKGYLTRVKVSLPELITKTKSLMH